MVFGTALSRLGGSKNGKTRFTDTFLYSPNSLITFFNSVSDLGIKEVSDIFRDEPYPWDESLRKKQLSKE